MPPPSFQDALPSASGLPPPGRFGLAAAAESSTTYAASLVAFCSAMRSLALQAAAANKRGPPQSNAAAAASLDEISISPSSVRASVADNAQPAAATALAFLVSLLEPSAATVEVAAAAAAAVDALVQSSAHAREVVLSGGGVPMLLAQAEAGGEPREAALSALSHLARRSADAPAQLVACTRLVPCLCERLREDCAALGDAAHLELPSRRGGVLAARTLNALATATPAATAARESGESLKGAESASNDASSHSRHRGRSSRAAAAAAGDGASGGGSGGGGGLSIGARTCIHLLGNGKRLLATESVIPTLIQLVTSNAPDAAYGQLLLTLLEFSVDAEGGGGDEGPRTPTEGWTSCSSRVPTRGHGNVSPGRCGHPNLSPVGAIERSRRGASAHTKT